jgi:hypothetical protein
MVGLVLPLVLRRAAPTFQSQESLPTYLPSRPTAAGRAHTYLEEHKRADDNVLA